MRSRAESTHFANITCRTCYCNHRPLASMIRLIREHGIRADEVTNVDVGFLPGADTALVSFNPANLGSAKNVAAVMAAMAPKEGAAAKATV